MWKKIGKGERMLEFYKGKKVLVTGHTGFKGSWLCTILKMAGAEVIGYSLPSSEIKNLFEIANIAEGMISCNGDIRNISGLEKIFLEYQPEIVFHLAAQPLVRESYINPVYTYETNVLGTVNLLECVRKSKTVRSVLNVTTDKVYENKEWEWGYRENENLNGYDPYSNSKSCSELVTSSYQKSFLNERDIRVSTARAGNVIGGGDFSKDRIIPDCIRAAEEEKTIIVRNPYAVRPFQHVIEPLMAYLLIAEKQWEDASVQGNYNVGPDEKDCVTVGKLTDIFCTKWGDYCSWASQQDQGPHEATYLRLDCSKIKQRLSWKSVWGIEEAIDQTVKWHKAYLDGGDSKEVMEQQINQYIKESIQIV